MHNSPFGSTGIRVSQIALGTGMLGMSRTGQIDRFQAADIVNAYLEAGGNFIDTSDAYLGGKSEEMLGEFLRGRREDVVLLTKYTRTTERTAAPARIGNHRKAMLQSVHASLKRLQTDCIDFYFAHVDDGVTPVVEIMRGFDDLVRQGKILFGGLSNFPAWRTTQAATLAGAKNWAPLSGLEVEYSLLQRTVEREILPLARDLGLGVLGYSPLATGMLAGKRNTVDPKHASRTGYPTEADVPRTFASLEKVAADRNSNPTNVALAWCMAKGVIPIVGVRDVAQLRENLHATALELTNGQLESLNSASAIPLGYPRSVLTDSFAD
jgi:aryl-alcohol dehydrogenase-like predicted oxidoreductase